MFAFPPTLDQLGFGINPSTLWLLRLFSLTCIFTSTYILFYLVNFRSKIYYWMFVIASPVFLLLSIAYPLNCIKILVVSISLFVILKLKKNIFISTIAMGLIVILVNIFIFKQKPAVIDIINFNAPGQEVAEKFRVEDMLTYPIDIPLQIKRITYNKIFLALKDFSNESLNFFDFETLFFQEVHPLGQKAFVIFFWPQIYIFLTGIWLVLIRKIKLDKNFWILVFASYIYFMTTDASSDRRLVFVLFPLAMLMSETTKLLLTEKKLLKFGFLGLIFLSFYGLITFHYDLSKRPDYWLDNRPLAYQFIFSNLPKYESKFEKILVPDTLFAAKQYCTYYASDCSKIEFTNFDLSKQQIQSGILYIGFDGNFLGPSPGNSFNQDLENKFSEMGLKRLTQTHIHDNIANEFGQNLIFASK